MPQMAPMSWLSLFSSFVVMFLIMSSMNYFSFNYSNAQPTISSKMHKLNWKW